MSIGDKIDTLYRTRAERLALAKQVDDLKLKETLCKEEIMMELRDMGLSRASGSLATAGRTSKIVPVIEDWDRVFEYIRDTNQFDLVQRRISPLAWSARLEDGILIPGTQQSEAFDLSLTKASR